MEESSHLLSTTNRSKLKRRKMKKARKGRKVTRMEKEKEEEVSMGPERRMPKERTTKVSKALKGQKQGSLEENAIGAGG